MSSTIKWLHEISGTNLIKKRRKMLSRKPLGLGPEDLVVLDKETKSFFSSKEINSFYHFLVGRKFDSPESFRQYFMELIKRQEHHSLLDKIEIVKGYLYSWNSFTHRDILITSSPTGATEAHAISSSNEEIEISKEDWYQLQLSNSLRFYFGSQPLLYSFFGTIPHKSQALKIFPVDNLTFNDFNYIIAHHHPSEELYMGISSGMLFSLCFDEIFAFLSKYGPSHPRIFTSFCRYIFPKSKLAPPLFELVESHIFAYPDDLETALYLAKYYIETEQYERCISNLCPLSSILKSSIPFHPQAAIICARYCISASLFSDAFCYLNASTFSKNWPISNFEDSHYPLTIPRNALEPGPNQIEIRIISAPFSSSKAHLFYAISELLQKMGRQRFLEMMSSYISSHSQSQQIQKQYPKFKKNLGEFTEEKSQLEKFKLNRASHLSKYELRGSIWPSNYLKVLPNSGQENYLSDDGVESNFSVPYSISNLPISTSFQNAIQDVLHADEKRNTINDGYSVIDDPSSSLILGLRLHDSNLIRLSYKLMKKQRITGGIEKLGLLFANIAGIGPELDEIIRLETRPLTETQQNAIDFTLRLAFALDKLEIETGKSKQGKHLSVPIGSFIRTNFQPRLKPDARFSLPSRK